MGSGICRQEVGGEDGVHRGMHMMKVSVLVIRFWMAMEEGKG